MKELAIIIPAFKSKFLRVALDSFEKQTNKNFQLYVFDDASPDNIKDICDSFKNNLDIIFDRFEENLGMSSLAQHWNRCIRNTQEPWVWLFSDDDIADPNCVEAFYEQLRVCENTYDLFRFNTLVINTEGKIIKINPPHPKTESNLEFIYHKFSSSRNSYVPEYIFSLNAFKREAGFEDFPLGWCTDDATWIKFSSKTGIQTIENACVYFRKSLFNISANNEKRASQKLDASLKFINWIKDYSFHSEKEYLNNNTIIETSRGWFLGHLLSKEHLVPFNQIFYFAVCINQIWGVNKYRTITRLCYANCSWLIASMKKKLKAAGARAVPASQP